MFIFKAQLQSCQLKNWRKSFHIHPVLCNTIYLSKYCSYFYKHLCPNILSLSKEIFSLHHSDYNVCVYKMCCHLVFISCKSKDRSRGYRITFYDFENLFRKYHVTIQNRLNGLSCKPNPKYKQKWCGARELCSCDRKLTLKFSQGLLRSLII